MTTWKLSAERCRLAVGIDVEMERHQEVRLGTTNTPWCGGRSRVSFAPDSDEY